MASDWRHYLEGKDPAFPERTLTAALTSICEDIQAMQDDGATADTRLAYYLIDMQPVPTGALLHLTTGGYFARRRVWVLHSRFRYFHPERRRAGLPEDAAALVDQLTASQASVTLVNTNPVMPRTITIQAGGYAEHEFTNVTLGAKTVPINGRRLTLRQAPRAGANRRFTVKRYARRPTFAFPWNQ
jgi:hypothetical protein